MTVIKRYFGLLSCTLIALYLFLSPTYALLNFRDYASELPHFMRYVLVPGLIGATFLALGLFSKPRFAAVAGINGLSVLLALFAFEGLLTFRSIPVTLGILGQFTDEQRENVVRGGAVIRGFALRELNRLSGTDKLSEALLSGFPATQVVLCASKDELITYTADRYGFNNPDQLYDRPLDLMLLGDSFVEGVCLPPGEDLASRLRSGGLVAASMGIRGNGPLIELATLGRFGRIFRPRHVVLVFFEGNDWENLEAELSEPWLRAALAPGADYGSQSTAQETLQRAGVMMRNKTQDRVTMADLLTKTKVFRNFVALQQTFTRLGLIYPKIAHRSSMPKFRETLHRAKVLSANWGGTLTIVYVPDIDRFMGAFSSDWAFDQLRTIVHDTAAAEGIEVIDLREALRGVPAPERMYMPDRHFSREGAAFAADVIFQRLKVIDQASSGQAAPIR